MKKSDWMSLEKAQKEMEKLGVDPHIIKRIESDHARMEGAEVRIYYPDIMEGFGGRAHFVHKNRLGHLVEHTQRLFLEEPEMELEEYESIQCDSAGYWFLDEGL